MMYAAAAAMNVAGYAPGHPLLGPWGGHHQCGAMEQGQRLPAWALSRVKPAVCMPQGREDGLDCDALIHSIRHRARGGWSDRLLRWVPMI